MKKERMSFFDWQARFDTEEACKEYLYGEKWPNGFQCPQCGHNHAHYLPSRGLYQCSGCHKQHSVTADTVFHSTKLPLTKWFWAIYWVSSDKGGISALRLTKLIGVSWPTARLMLKKLRETMGHRDSLYRLTEHIELDDAFVGGKQKGKRGRGASGKKPVIVACESQGNRAGYIAIEAVERINHDTIEQFSIRKLLPDQIVYTDAFRGLTSLANTQEHQSRPTPAEKVDEWLPWVHIVIGNLKRFLLGTYHGVQGKYLQEYINEFCYRFNRRRWEPEIPARLLAACATHLPLKSC
jgi:transposase-like protein